MLIFNFLSLLGWPVSPKMHFSQVPYITVTEAAGAAAAATTILTLTLMTTPPNPGLQKILKRTPTPFF